MTPRVVCSIDLDALTHNLDEVRRLVGPAVRVCAVVKANAYGHGAIPVARTLERAGVHALAVTSVDEARELRESGVALPLLILSGVDPENAKDASRLGLTPVVWEPRQLRALVGALPAGARLPVHLKVDTGMRRLGTDDAAALAATARGLPVTVDGVLSHLACAEEPGHPSVEAQIRAFACAASAMGEAGVRPRLRHLANSAGVLLGPVAHFDMVRPGLLLYGCLPAPAREDAPRLRPVMELRTWVLHVKTVPAGSGVGYGWTWRTSRESRLAVLPVGYAQGYPRALSNRAEVSVRGKRAPVAGNVSMDHITVDVTGIEGVAPGDAVTLWGGPDGPDVADLAARAGTISYELLTRVAHDAPRIYEGRKE